MASYPWFDPNNYAHVAANDPARLRNPAVTDAFEPGSVNKVITAAAAIESGAVSMTQRFRVPDSMQVDQYTIHDSHAHPVETMTLADIVAESSNIGIAKVGGIVGKTTLASYLNRFGFGRTTGLGFPGESAGHRPGALELERRHPRHHLVRTGRERDAAPDGVGLRDGRERRRLGPPAPGERHRGRLGHVLAGAGLAEEAGPPTADRVHPRADARVRGRGRDGDQRADPRIPGRRQDRERRSSPRRTAGTTPTATSPRSSGSCRPATRGSWSRRSSTNPPRSTVASPPLRCSSRSRATRSSASGIPTAPPVSLPPHVLGRP